MFTQTLKITALLALASNLCAETLADGTPIRLRLNETLHSGRNKVGQGVSLSVVEDVIIGGKTVIAAGARASGRVLMADGKRSMGRAGKLDFTAEKVALTDGRMGNLRATEQGASGGGRSVKTGILTAGLAVAFWPAAPIALLIKGKDVEIPTGTVFTTFTDGQVEIQEAAPPTVIAAATAAASTAASTAKNDDAAVLQLNSSAVDAEIEIDGRFVGQAPAKLNLTAGRHRVVVRSGSQVWERSLELNSGNSVSLHANFAGQTTTVRR